MEKEEQQVQVFFDGSCPLCQKEVQFYKGVKTQGSVCYIDVSQMPEGEERTKKMQRFHVRDESGVERSGAAAFVYLWSKMKGWRVLARIFSGKRALSVLEFGYKKFLMVRPWLQKMAGKKTRQ